MPTKISQNLPPLLLEWYGKHARPLPWRKDRNPYKIWVSEIMLQQTQVKTVIPYFERWVKRFPNLETLANTSQEEVLKYWAGLGYYRRARMLYKGSKEVLTSFSGKIPRDPQLLIKIPGIGRYTAGAIASIAFDEKAAILDGNVIRILTRIHAIRSNVKSSKTISQLWNLAHAALPDQRSGDFNQAMMELGATVCLPETPKCSSCPVTRICKAYKLGQQTKFPVNSLKEKIEKIENYSLIFRKENKVLIQKQSERGRWGGLWMFPFWQNKKEMLLKTKLTEKDLTHRGIVKHGFTRYQIKLHVFETNSLSAFNPQRSKWISLQTLDQFAFPAPHKKIIIRFLENNHT